VTAHRQRGQASVEFAFMLPLLFGLLLVVAQVGLVVVDDVLAVNAAREAVRAAVVTSGDPMPPARRAAIASGRLDPTHLELSISDDGATMTARVSYRIAVIVPFARHFVGQPAVVVQARMAREN